MRYITREIDIMMYLMIESKVRDVPWSVAHSSSKKMMSWQDRASWHKLDICSLSSHLQIIGTTFVYSCLVRQKYAVFIRPRYRMYFKNICRQKETAAQARISLTPTIRLLCLLLAINHAKQQ